MAHIRKPLIVAAAINTVIFVEEAVAGTQGRSVSLLADAVHNFSDELALVCLALAYIFPLQASRSLQRAANLLNSVGLVAISGFVLWQSVERLLHPAPVLGLVSVGAGLVAAAGNWTVARTLQRVQHMNPAIRLAYLHNLGDVYVSLVPVGAGLLVAMLGWSWIDAVAGMLVAVWLITTTFREVSASAEDLLWPDDAVCKHDDLQVALP